MKRFVKRLVFSLIVLFVLLLLVGGGAELWLRATSCYGSAPSMNAYIAHPLLGWVGRPNTDVVRSMAVCCSEYRYNRYGFRGPDRPLAKPSDTYRVVVLGDSFLEGYHFPDDKLMTTQLENQLAEVTGRPVEVINLGISGWGTAQEVLSYQQLGRRFQPDLVILLYASCNDVINASRVLSEIFNERMKALKPYFELVDGQLKLQLPGKRLVRSANQVVSRRNGVPGFEPWELMSGFPNLLCRSRFGYWLYTRWDRPSRLRLLLDDWGLMTFDEKLYATTWGENGYYRGLSLRFWIYARIPDALWGDAVRVEAELIRSLAKAVSDNQGQFLLVSGANIEQVDTDIWELTLRTQPSLRRFRLDLDQPEKALGLLAAREGFAYLPLVPAFRQARQRGKELFLRGDGHWNSAGQKKAAETIADFLVNNYFVTTAR